MAIYLYSAEGFPGENSKTEYIQVLGHQIVLEAGKWLKLPTRMDNPYWTDFRHRGEGSTNKAVGHANHQIHVNDEIADEVMLRYAFRGVVRMDQDPDAYHGVALKLQEKSLEQNKKWREHIVARFENERKMRNLTGHGRLEPTPYELECYRVLGLPEPGSIDEIKAEKGLKQADPGPAVPATLTPELMDLIQEALQARAERKLAANAPVIPPIQAPAEQAPQTT